MSKNQSAKKKKSKKSGTKKIQYLNAPGDELNWKPYEIKDFGSFGKSFFTFISTYLIGF